MVNSIKVPSLLIKISNKKSLLEEVYFYYRLKSISRDGTFIITTFIDFLKADLKMSKTSAYEKRNRLIELGWLKKGKFNKYRLINYDDLWKDLGYDVKYDNIKKRKGKFAIYRLNSNSVETLKTFINTIAKKEIERSIRQIQWSKKRERTIQQTKKGGHNINSAYSAIPVRKVSSLLGFQSPQTGLNIINALEKAGEICTIRAVGSNGINSTTLILIP